MQDYLLLYSTLGYPLRGTKRALLRQYADAPARTPAAWTATDERGRTLTGAPRRAADTFGCALWTCDFSAVDREGVYTVTVTFTDGSEARSEPFRIMEYPYFGQISLRLSVHSAKARLAVGEPTGGYYDCNSKMGEAYSHGSYLAGLCWLYFCHEKRLSPEERGELQWAAQVAFDYLLRLRRPDTGEIVNYAPERVFDPNNFGIHNTIEGLYGLAAYMDVFRDKDPERVTDENYRLLLQSIQYAREQSLAEERRTYAYDEWLAPVCCHLYKAFGEASLLDTAKQSVEKLLETFDWPAAFRGDRRPMSYFEGMWMLKALMPDIADSALWRGKLALLTAQLAKQQAENAYLFPPPSDAANALREWADTRPMLHGRGERRVMWTADVLRCALDGCFLGLLTGEAVYEKVVAGGIGFITGINFGLPRSKTVNAAGEGEHATASFIANAGPHASPWVLWYFTMRNQEWASVINGYTVENGEYLYTDEDWPHGETFIKTDGMLLCAASLYECWLNGDRQALDFRR